MQTFDEGNRKCISPMKRMHKGGKPKLNNIKELLSILFNDNKASLTKLRKTINMHIKNQKLKPIPKEKCNSKLKIRKNKIFIKTPDGKFVPNMGDFKKPPSTPINKESNKSMADDSKEKTVSQRKNKKDLTINFFSEKRIDKMDESPLLSPSNQLNELREQAQSPNFGLKTTLKKNNCLKTHKRASTIVEKHFDGQRLKSKLKDSKKIINLMQPKHNRRCKSRITEDSHHKNKRKPRKVKSSFDLKENKNDKKCKKNKQTNKQLKLLEVANQKIRKKSCMYGYRNSQTHSFIDWKCFNFDEQDNEGSSNSSSVSSNNSISQLDFNYTIKLNNNSK